MRWGQLFFFQLIWRVALRIFLVKIMLHICLLEILMRFTSYLDIFFNLPLNLSTLSLYILSLSTCPYLFLLTHSISFYTIRQSNLMTLRLSSIWLNFRALPLCTVQCTLYSIWLNVFFTYWRACNRIISHIQQNTPKLVYQCTSLSHYTLSFYLYCTSVSVSLSLSIIFLSFSDAKSLRT